MYSVYKIIANILGYHTLSDGAQDMTVTRYIIATTRDDAIATCGAVIGQEVGEEGTFSSLKIVECSVVDTETIDLVAMLQILFSVGITFHLVKSGMKCWMT